MEPRMTGTHEAYVASIAEDNSTVTGHFKLDGQSYGIEITRENFPEMPFVGQYFEMDFDKLHGDKDEVWISLREVTTWTQAEIDEINATLPDYAALIEDPTTSKPDDTQQSA